MRRLPLSSPAWLALFAVLLLPAVAWVPATGTLAGTVTDEGGVPLAGASVLVAERPSAATTDAAGRYRIEGLEPGRYTVRVSALGYAMREQRVRVTAGRVQTLDVALAPMQLQEVTIQGLPRPLPPPPASPPLVRSRASGAPSPVGMAAASVASGGMRAADRTDDGWRYAPPTDREGYAPNEELGFRQPVDTPLSTFSIDVDRASYANVRRMLTAGHLPPADAVRVEEFVNAFGYDLPGPSTRDPHPFLVTTETARAPWADGHHLVRVALQGRRIDTRDLPPANLVFLLDVSGSMGSPDKLPLLKSAFRLLVREMRPQDRVAIVVYAGASGLVLEPTPGTQKETILDALDRLQAGGSTAGAAGLQLAYDTARRHFDPAATNRVILATDGDFNVGPSSDAEMLRLVERERGGGVFLSVLGFGTGNLQDSKMETLADHGNGNYSYIDSIREAERVLVREIGGTLFAIAKDVKLQVEFNPAHVAAYRLIGYENRALAAEDFNDDAKDAGELGAGHTVTALYEVVLVGDADGTTPAVDPLRYQRSGATRAADSDEWMTVALRYKPATGPASFAEQSVRLEVPVLGADRPLDTASEAMRWAVAVTETALLLRESDYAPDARYAHARALAQGARGRDPHGDRAEFIGLIDRAAALAEGDATEEVTMRD